MSHKTIIEKIIENTENAMRRKGGISQKLSKMIQKLFSYLNYQLSTINYQLSHISIGDY